MNERARIILHFWFKESLIDEIFSNNKEFDQKIKDNFLKDYNKAINNDYDEWKYNAKECLALIIILDQFSRNLFRNNCQAFAMDKKVRSIVKEAINKNYSKTLV